MIALIDYGAGNLRSVQKALLHVGAKVEIVTGPERLLEAQAAVLPGVGAFDDCANSLQKQNLFGAIRSFIDSGRPFLGICVGYQILFERSEEFNNKAPSPGLGVFKGKVVRFSEENRLKVPQIGWNELEIVRPDCPLYNGIPNGSFVFFVHSYYPKPDDESIIASRTDYGTHFASSVWRKNLFATQFHPEKSQKVGLQLLKNFVALEKQS